MMPRRSLDNNNTSIDPQHEQNLYYQQQQQYSRGRTSIPHTSMVATTAGYSQVPPFQPGNESGELRRYSLSVAPGNTAGGGLPEQQQQMGYAQLQQQPQQVVMMSPNQPHPTMTTFRQQESGAYMAEMSPTVAQRMQVNTMYLSANAGQQSYGNGGGQPSQQAGELPPEAEMRQQQGGPMSQAEREEEMLLNLLIARRQRGQGGDTAHSQALADELMRLRQSRGAQGLPSIPVFQGGEQQPPQQHQMYHSQQAMAGGSQMYPSNQTNVPGMAQADMSGRIDRVPTRLVDARTQEMMDQSARGGIPGKRGYPEYYKYSTGHPMDPSQQHFYSSQVGPQGGHAMQQPPAPPVKKRRIHKKKPADMPRRPLSAYNLFFSEERERILKEIEEQEGGDKPKEEGENKTEEEETKAPEEETGEKDEEGDDKPKALMRPLIPAQKKRRPHRKTHGKISFQKLARMVGERWKSLDDERRQYYKDLAKEDMARQKIAMEEYYAKQNAAKLKAERAGKEGPEVKKDDASEKDTPSEDTGAAKDDAPEGVESVKEDEPKAQNVVTA